MKQVYFLNKLPTYYIHDKKHIDLQCFINCYAEDLFKVVIKIPRRHLKEGVHRIGLDRLTGNKTSQSTKRT